MKRVWMVLSLTLTCTLAALALSIVYASTKPVIQRQAARAAEAALRDAMPGATRFEEQLKDSLWFAYDSSGSKIGAVLRTVPRGYGGPIVVTAGIDTVGQVTGIVIMPTKETPGLGLKAAESGFRNQFLGKQAAQVRLRRDGGSIDAITAATITSRAVANALAAAIERYQEHLRQ